jgi:UDP-hydrolysing UDP-N-acetyl-D-glucosamine 2-epimerase
MVGVFKVCVVTATRAEYGLLKPLLRAVAAAPDLDLQLVVTGTHLSPEFGYTAKEIIADGFSIDEQVEMLVSSDSSVGVCKSMGLAMIGYGEALGRLKPDIMVVLGDRYEILCAAAASAAHNIPIAHLHGGEVTEGAVDDAFRHAITKLSHLHFTSTEPYRQRVIQLGEQPDRVFNVGAIGLDSIRVTKFMSVPEIGDSLGFDLSPGYLLVTYHPETIVEADAAHDVRLLLDTLLNSYDGKILVTGANADKGGRAINQALQEIANAHSERVCVVSSLGQLRYLSAASHAHAVVGNSSSGIIEVPSLKTPTLNIGARQHGRIRADSVIDVPLDAAEITAALDMFKSPEFQRKIELTVNPYGDGHTADYVMEHLRQHLAVPDLFRKRFYDATTY